MNHKPLSLLLVLALGSVSCGSDVSPSPLRPFPAFTGCTLDVSVESEKWACDPSGPHRLECKAYPGPCASGTCDYPQWTPVGSCKDSECKSCVNLKDSCSFSSSRTADTCSTEGTCLGAKVVMTCKQDGTSYLCSCGTKIQPGKTFQGPACQQETWTYAVPFTAWIQCAPVKS
jgi:hypothetical protein